LITIFDDAEKDAEKAVVIIDVVAIIVQISKAVNFFSFIVRPPIFK
jgi:hypothetical protein